LIEQGKMAGKMKTSRPFNLKEIWRWIPSFTSVLKTEFALLAISYHSGTFPYVNSYFKQFDL